MDNPPSSVLLESTNASNTMPEVQKDPAIIELNGLKAAFRTAIGVTKKNKKSKSSKQRRADESTTGDAGGEEKACHVSVSEIEPVIVQENSTKRMSDVLLVAID